MGCFSLFLEPVVVDPVDTVAIRFTDSGGAKTATIPGATYYLLGDGSSVDLVAAVVAALGTASVDTYSATLDFGLDVDALGDGDARGASLVITSSSASFVLQMDDALTTIDPTLLGFSEATTAAGAVQTSDVAPSCAWVPDEIAFPELIEEDIDGEQTQARGGAVYSWEAGVFEGRRLTFEDLEGRRVLEEYAEGGTFQAFRRRVGGSGTFRLYRSSPTGSDLIRLADSTDLELVGEFVLDEETAFGPWRPARDSDALDLFTFEIAVRKTGSPSLPAELPSPATVVLDFDADDPGTGNAPHNRGSNGNVGLLSLSGTGMSYLPTNGPGGGATWSNIGTGGAYYGANTPNLGGTIGGTFTVATVFTVSGAFNATLWRYGAAGTSIPYMEVAQDPGGTTTAFRMEYAGSKSPVGSGEPLNTWAVIITTRDASLAPGASVRNYYALLGETVLEVGALAADANSLGETIFFLGSNSGGDHRGACNRSVAWDSLVDPDSILAYFNERYPV